MSGCAVEADAPRDTCNRFYLNTRLYHSHWIYAAHRHSSFFQNPCGSNTIPLPFDFVHRALDFNQNVILKRFSSNHVHLATENHQSKLSQWQVLVERRQVSESGRILRSIGLRLCMRPKNRSTTQLGSALRVPSLRMRWCRK
jgi:hypothetical protein